jgi:hypothetical protein
LTCWPDDGGPFITLPMVYTHNPNTGRRNVGMYRVQIYDRNTTGMHWQMHKVGAQHHREAQEKKQKIEAAICLGGDPCLPFCAIAPLPEEIDEMMFAGFLRGKPVDMVKCETIDVRVPADCEYVIEGTIDPDEVRPEGPSAITPATTRRLKIIPCFASRASRTAKSHLSCDHRRHSTDGRCLLGRRGRHHLPAVGQNSSSRTGRYASAG